MYPWVPRMLVHHSCCLLQSADSTDIYTISRNWADLVKRARAKQLQPQEYNSLTFTLSNLGMFGADTFDAILPPGKLPSMSIQRQGCSVHLMSGFFVRACQQSSLMGAPCGQAKCGALVLFCRQAASQVVGTILASCKAHRTREWHVFAWERLVKRQHGHHASGRL